MSEPSLADLPELLKTHEFSRALRKSPGFTFQEIKAGRLRATRVGQRVWRIPRSEVYRYLGLEDPNGGRDAT